MCWLELEVLIEGRTGTGTYQKFHHTCLLLPNSLGNQCPPPSANSALFWGKYPCFCCRQSPDTSGSVSLPARLVLKDSLSASCQGTLRRPLSLRHASHLSRCWDRPTYKWTWGFQDHFRPGPLPHFSIPLISTSPSKHSSFPLA